MDRDLLSALLCTSVNRLGKQSPELMHLAVAGQKGLWLKLNQWREILDMFMHVIDRKGNEKELLWDINVKTWLDDVRDLADDVEEILDEIANQALMAPRQTITGKKCFSKGFIPDYLTGLKKSSVVTAFGDSLSSKIIDTTSRLEKLNTKRYALRLLRELGRFERCSCRKPELLESTSLPTETIDDRDNDKMKILEMLLMGEASNHANFSIIPIIGVAEIDKTRLARLVYDDKAVKDFKPRAWVSVSKDSDVLRVSKAILESITSKSCNLEDLNEVLVELKEAIIGNKFLFVLDDVLTKNYGLWETLKSSFMAGAPGSKIIVTTCRVDIEFPIDLNIRPYTLEVLSDETCWSVFKMHAFDREDNGVHQDLELIREKVLDMCKGLPLAASILGGLLRFEPSSKWKEVLNNEICGLAEDNEILPVLKLSYHYMCKGLSLAASILCGLLSFKPSSEWKEVMNNEIRDLAEDNEILPVLKLSYHYLSSSLKRCFAYCAILPKNYEFDKDELVFLWMAEGLIGGPLEYQHMEYEQMKDRQMEEELSMWKEELWEKELYGDNLDARKRFKEMRRSINQTEDERRKEEETEDEKVKDQRQLLDDEKVEGQLREDEQMEGQLREDEQMEGQLTEDEQMEDIGSQFFQELLKRSLFQYSNSHVSKFRMHDHVKKMAHWISGETDFRLEDVSGINKQPKRFKRACHSDTSDSCDGTNKFELYYDVEHLRTFLPGFISNEDTHWITDMVLSDLLPKFKRLRALSLEKQKITELPSSVEGLRYLRYVNLSNTMITRLPDSICSLLMLQIMLLRDCSRLVELPSNMRSLINLRHLDVTGINLMREMPIGMKELKCLRTLLNFIVGKCTGSDLKDLENLKFLRELYISRLGNVIGSRDTKDSILIDKKGLKVLVLEWGSQLDDTRDELAEENVMDRLQPHQNLKELTIRGYSGSRFPSWVGDSAYSNIVVLTLERCEKCTVLPSLGCLGSLEHLTITGMTGIKRIGSEIFGRDCSSSFKALETLCFQDLQEWEHWDPVEENEHAEIFPRLCELSLVKCPKLRRKIPELYLLSLKKLSIQECGQLVVSFSSLPSFCEAEVDGCKVSCGSQI